METNTDNTETINIYIYHHKVDFSEVKYCYVKYENQKNK